MGRASFAEEASAPDTPSSGYVTFYFLSASSGVPVVKDDTGAVFTVAMEEKQNVFTVKQEVTASSTPVFKVTGESTNPNIEFHNDGDTTAGRAVSIQFHHGNAEGARIQCTRESGDSDGMDMAFYTEKVGGAAAQRMRIDDAGSIFVGGASTVPSGKVHIDQNDASGTVPVLVLDQADLSEEYVDFITATTGAGDPVDTSTAVGTTYARLRVAVNGTFKYLQLYNA